MKKKVVYAVWGVLYGACAALGFVTPATGFAKAMLTLFSLIFFVPGFYLAFLAKKENDRKALLALRLISGGILALSLVFLVLNFLSVYFSAHTGLTLYVLLVMFSAPMVCSQVWVLSLFLWACLLMVTLPEFKKNCSCQK